MQAGRNDSGGETMQLDAELLNTVRGSADVIDRERALPVHLIDALHDAGAFRALIPRACGGLETPLPDYLDTVRELAMADASTAWCVNQGAVIGTTTLWLPLDAIHELWANPRQCVANGPPLETRLEATAAGGRVTGRWGFSSGCRHALTMTGAVRRADDGAWRVVFFPVARAAFEDDWHTAGLRGTGSLRFSVNELVVPERFVTNLAARPTVDSPLTRLATGLVFAVTFASLALGVARRGLDITLELASEKKPIYARDALREDPTVHDRLGRLEARWRAAQAYLREDVHAVWEAIHHQDAMSEAQRARWRLAGTHVLREAVDAMRGAYEICGSTAIYAGDPLHRPWQDMQVIAQHVQARAQYYAFSGRYLTGHPYEFGPLS